MIGTVPNPTCPSDTYGGEAYLVLNDGSIPLNVIKSASGSGWSFRKEFSVDPGPNTIRIEIYDLSDDLFAATSVWNIIGTIEPSSDADIYDVILDDLNLTSFPDVTLTVTVTDSGAHVSGLTSENFYVVNAGTRMSDVTVTENENTSSYTLEYTDITSGKRDLYVYVYVPDTPIKGGLSDTTTYGKNYALLVGLNEYPPWLTTSYDWDRDNFTIDVEPRAGQGPYVEGDFGIYFYTDSIFQESISVDSIEEQVGGTYRLRYTAPSNHDNYNWASVKFAREAWLNNCINDIEDLEEALKAKATSMDNSAWEDENIYRLEDSAATKSAITDKIAEIANDMQKYDLFLFHFSGHGTNGSDDNSQYICAYEDDNWISVTDLSNALDDIPKPGANSYINNAFVFLDTCHSGNFIGRGMQGGFLGNIDRTKVRKFRPFIAQLEEEPLERGSLTFSRDLQDTDNKDHVFVMTAAAGHESSWDDGTLENGVFTYYLVEGIKLVDPAGDAIYISGAPANDNNDTWITAEEAFFYLDPKVEARVSSYGIGEVQDPQSQDNSSDTVSRLIYNW